MLTAMRGLHLRTRPGHPAFLDLPWHLPLSDWSSERLVSVSVGLHRHVVRFVDYDGALYALKELPLRVARREYGMLRRMAEESLPVVEVVGVADRSRAANNGDALESVLITRYLDYSLPYRTLFRHQRSAAPSVDDLFDRLLDALVVLLVRLHLTGFYWGDCSLSNTLFRRDAGALAAYLVDAETGEWHPELTEGQRETDLEITQLNVAGGLLDLQAQLGLPPDPDPVETAEDLRRRYERLWAELMTSELIRPDEHYRVDARIRRLNELGFDVDEIEFSAGEEGDQMRLQTVVTEQGHHRRRLFELTGLVAQENQARSLLNDLANYRSWLERDTGRPVPESLAAYRWLSQLFEPAVAAIPEAQRGKLEAAEVYHEIVEHKWFLSEVEGRDIGIEQAVQSYIDTVLPAAPEERTVLTSEEASAGWIGYG